MENSNRKQRRKAIWKAILFVTIPLFFSVGATYLIKETDDVKSGKYDSMIAERDTFLIGMNSLNQQWEEFKTFQKKHVDKAGSLESGDSSSDVDDKKSNLLADISILEKKLKDPTSFKIYSSYLENYKDMISNYSEYAEDLKNDRKNTAINTAPIYDLKEKLSECKKERDNFKEKYEQIKTKVSNAKGNFNSSLNMLRGLKLKKDEKEKKRDTAIKDLEKGIDNLKE